MDNTKNTKILFTIIKWIIPKSVENIKIEKYKKSGNGKIIKKIIVKSVEKNSNKRDNTKKICS